ncbi:hypothetical protein IAI18_06910 [Acetobacteraceae bacterium H6797]|nr:hypothetical protein [Acetobacteraceae bacterium H6797]
MRKIVYEDEFIAIVMNGRSRGERVIVSFGFLPDETGDTTVGFGETVFERAGIPGIYVLPKGKHWYSFDLMRAALRRIRRLRDGFRHCTTYGASMGGYAALQFATALEADRIVAFSPQTNIDMGAIQDLRWANIWPNLRPHPTLALPPGAQTTVIYDKLNREDRAHVDRLAGMPVTAIHVPFGGHQVVSLLARMKLASRVAVQLCTGTFDPVAFRAEVRAARSRTDDYFKGLLETVIYSGRSNADERGMRFLPRVLESGYRLEQLGRLHRRAEAHGLMRTAQALMEARRMAVTAPAPARQPARVPMPAPASLPISATQPVMPALAVAKPASEG